jgi:hypothetical protein
LVDVQLKTDAFVGTVNSFVNTTISFKVADEINLYFLIGIWIKTGFVVN